MAIKTASCPWGVGAKTQTNIAFETEYGAPDGKYRINLPFNSNGVASSQNSTDPATIRGDRNPVEAIMGNNDVSGDIVVPVDFTALGYWLALAIGVPTTSGGGGKYSHIFKIGNSLPSFTLEKAFPGIGQYIHSHGCKVSKIDFSFGGDGELTTTVSVMGGSEEVKQEAMAGELIAPTFDRGNNFQCDVSVGGVHAGRVTTLSLTIDNGLDGDTYTIGSKGFREAICDGLAKVSGTLEAFFKDAEYLEMAEKSEETSLEIAVKMNDDMQLHILLPEVKFARTSPPIEGPAGVKQSIAFNGFLQDNEYGSAVVVTLNNAYPTYGVPTGEEVILPIGTKTDFGAFGQASDFYDTPPTIHWDGDKGTIEGTLKKFAGNEKTGEGYWLPIVLSDWFKGMTVSVFILHEKPGVYQDWIVKVENGETPLTIKVGNTVVAAIDLASLQLAEA